MARSASATSGLGETTSRTKTRRLVRLDLLLAPGSSRTTVPCDGHEQRRRSSSGAAAMPTPASSKEDGEVHQERGVLLRVKWRGEECCLGLILTEEAGDHGDNGGRGGLRELG